MSNEFYVGFGVKSTIIPGCSEDDYDLKGVAKFTAESQAKAEGIPGESAGRIQARLEPYYRGKNFEVVVLGKGSVYDTPDAAMATLHASADRPSLVSVEI